MAQLLSPESFLQLNHQWPVIDVRSPAEYELGHIPGAISFPLFSNEERAQVGTRYKQSGKEFALELGLDIIGPKMSAFVRQAKKIAPQRKILIHCWRGGMRSASMGWLLETAGFEVGLLQGGYKAYRHYVRESFSKCQNLLVLGGFTGSGKTEVLKALQLQGEQVLDLEGIGNHKGSAFGAIGQEPQPTNEQFENELGKVWQTLNLTKRIWVEDESKALGTVSIPETLFQKLREAKVVRIIIPKPIRELRLVDEYASLDKEQLRSAIERIERRLGGLRTRQAIEYLEQSDFQKVAELTLHYYDKAYLLGIGSRKPETIIEEEFEHFDASTIASRLIQMNL